MRVCIKSLQACNRFPVSYGHLMSTHYSYTLLHMSLVICYIALHCPCVYVDSYNMHSKQISWFSYVSQHFYFEKVQAIEPSNNLPLSVDVFSYILATCSYKCLVLHLESVLRITGCVKHPTKHI